MKTEAAAPAVLPAQALAVMLGLIGQAARNLKQTRVWLECTGEHLRVTGCNGVLGQRAEVELGEAAAPWAVLMPPDILASIADQSAGRAVRLAPVELEFGGRHLSVENGRGSWTLQIYPEQQALTVESAGDGVACDIPWLMDSLPRLMPSVEEGAYTVLRGILLGADDDGHMLGCATDGKQLVECVSAAPALDQSVVLPVEVCKHLLSVAKQQATDLSLRVDGKVLRWRSEHPADGVVVRGDGSSRTMEGVYPPYRMALKTIDNPVDVELLAEDWKSIMTAVRVFVSANVSGLRLSADGEQLHVSNTSTGGGSVRTSAPLQSEARVEFGVNGIYLGHLLKYHPDEIIKLHWRGIRLIILTHYETDTGHVTHGIMPITLPDQIERETVK